MLNNSLSVCDNNALHNGMLFWKVLGLPSPLSYKSNNNAHSHVLINHDHPVVKYAHACCY